ncbi:uncharacterized protein TRIADDRAFT_57722 [Trichoplax adhaerens]|uniref:Sfi1 spindle body domain-containing protein n=1 Tax=Trichoplax adhaerens TaxID=10228 RepID=B3S085_TRIAD|nr:predicted protein [Trichoplax adhaerens]EDV23964.1 predicted protein [Trichoplax adhaerens]|eukprot:XP_002113490.1 predicted protein [Trichoplax adhaerens]
MCDKEKLDIHHRHVNKRILEKSWLTWQKRYADRRYTMIRQAFSSWRQFVITSARATILKNNYKRQVLITSYKIWKAKFSQGQALKISSLHYKITLLSKHWNDWRTFIINERIKKRQNEVARIFREESTIKRIFPLIKESFQRHQKAKTYYKCKSFSKYLKQWHDWAQHSRAYHLHQNSTAMEHRKIILVQSMLSRWQEKFKDAMADKTCHTKLMKKYINVWIIKYHSKLHLHQLAENKGKKCLQRRILLKWRENAIETWTVRQKFIQRLKLVRLRMYFLHWKQNTRVLGDLRQCQIAAVTSIERLQMMSVLRLWKQKLENRFLRQVVKQKLRQRLIRKTASKWLKLLERRKLKDEAEHFQSHRRYVMLQASFHRWCAAYEQIRMREQSIQRGRLILNHQLTRNIFNKWRLQLYRSRLIAPLLARVHRKIVNKAFDRWYLFIKQRQQHQDLYDLYQRQKKENIFHTWKDKCITKQLSDQFLNKVQSKKLQNVFNRWKGGETILIYSTLEMYYSHQYPSIMDRYGRNLRTKRIFRQWKSKFENINQELEVKMATLAREKALLRSSFKLWLLKFNKKYKDWETLSSKFYAWIRYYKLYKMANGYKENANREHLKRYFNLWHDIATKVLEYKEFQLQNNNLTKHPKLHPLYFTSITDSLQIYQQVKKSAIRKADISNLLDENMKQSFKSIKNTPTRYILKRMSPKTGAIKFMPPPFHRCQSENEFCLRSNYDKKKEQTPDSIDNPLLSDQNDIPKRKATRGMSLPIIITTEYEDVAELWTDRVDDDYSEVQARMYLNQRQSLDIPTWTITQSLMRTHSIDSWPSQNSDGSGLKHSEHETKDGSSVCTHADAYSGDISSISSSKPGGPIIYSEGLHDNDSDIFINHQAKSNKQQTLIDSYHHENAQRGQQDESEISSQQSVETVTPNNNPNIDQFGSYIDYLTDRSQSLFTNTMLSSYSDENALSESTSEISPDILIRAYRNDTTEGEHFNYIAQMTDRYYSKKSSQHDSKMDEETGKGSSIEGTSENSPIERDHVYDINHWPEYQDYGNGSNIPYASNLHNSHHDDSSPEFKNDPDINSEYQLVDMHLKRDSLGSESSGIQLATEDLNQRYYDPLIGLRHRGRSLLELKSNPSLSSLVTPTKKRSYTDSKPSIDDIKKKIVAERNVNDIRRLQLNGLNQQSQLRNRGTIRKPNKFNYILKSHPISQEKREKIIQDTYLKWRSFIDVQSKRQEILKKIIDGNDNDRLEEFFLRWKGAYRKSVQASRLQKSLLMESALMQLYKYKEYRAHKKDRQALAMQLHQRLLIQRFFIHWLERTSSKQKYEDQFQKLGLIVEAKDKQLEDTRRKFVQICHKRKLRISFNIWLSASKHQQFARQFYEENLCKSKFKYWFTSFQKSKDRENLCHDFIVRTCLRKIFNHWRFSANSKVDSRNMEEAINKNNMIKIMKIWRWWSAESKRQKQIAMEYYSHIQGLKRKRYFQRWINQWNYSIRAKQHYNNNLAKNRVLINWHQVAHKRALLRKQEDQLRKQIVNQLLKKALTLWKNAHETEKLVKNNCHKRIMKVAHDAFIALRMHALEIRKNRYCEKMVMKKYYDIWTQEYQSLRKSKISLLRVYILSWYKAGRDVKDMNAAANAFSTSLDRKLMKGIFYRWRTMWFSKNRCKKMITKRIFHAWKLYTSEIKTKKMKINSLICKRNQYQIQEAFVVWKDALKQVNKCKLILEDFSKKKDSIALRNTLVNWRLAVIYQRLEVVQIRRCQAKHFKLWMKRFREERLTRKGQEVVKYSKLSTIFYKWHQYVIKVKTCRNMSQKYKIEQISRQVQLTFYYWNKTTKASQSAIKHYQQHLMMKIWTPWLEHSGAKKVEKSNIKQIQQQIANRRLKQQFMKWKEQFKIAVKAKTAVTILKQKREDKLKQMVIHEFKINALECRADRFHIKKKLMMVFNVMKVQSKKLQEKSAKLEALLTTALMQSYSNLSREYFIDWKQSYVERNQLKMEKRQLLIKYYLSWKTRAINQIKAKKMRQLCLLDNAWSQWRRLFIRIRVVNLFVEQDNKQLLSKVLGSWHAWASNRCRLRQLLNRKRRKLLQEFYYRWQDRYNFK